MTRTQAAALLKLLIAAFPKTPVEDDTTDLWLNALRPVDHGLGETAIRSLVDAVKFFPTIAELNEHLTIVREQTARDRREAERREADRAYDLLPHPPLRDIPAAAELRERFGEPPPTLELAPDGDCDDRCGRTGVRYLLGRVQVCATCAQLRLKAREAA
jgi:Loader and inhibitor of phage G40P